jgi:hypothetical protein
MKNLDLKFLENLIKRYETAIKNKNKEVRFSIEEMSLIVSSIAKILIYAKNLEEIENKENKDSKTQKQNEDIIEINIDSGFFKK